MSSISGRSRVTLAQVTVVRSLARDKGQPKTGLLKVKKNCQAENYALAWRRPTVNVHSRHQLKTMPLIPSQKGRQRGKQANSQPTNTVAR